MAFISAKAFNINYHRREITGIILIYEINSELNYQRMTKVENHPGLIGDIIELKEIIYKYLPQWLKDFIDIFLKIRLNQLPPYRAFDHKITLLQEPDTKLSPLYKMSTPELEEVRKYLIKNLKKGYITLSDSPFASPVLFVKKKDGSLRFYVNYRRLNAISKKDRYPLPLIKETLTRISKAKIFTKIDIRQTFHRIRMDLNSEMLTTFRTRYGSYNYRVLPFGLSNGPSTYQRYINDVLFDYLNVFYTAYLNDILIYSDNELEYQKYVRKVL